MARPKKAKHRNEPESFAHTLDELESTGDRITDWVIENPRTVLGVGALILVAAAGYAFAHARTESNREEASAALGEAQAEFRQAMGASLDDVIVPEPANPETARQVREEYAERFAEIAASHAGTAGGAIAGLEAGNLEEALGQTDEAVATWQESARQIGSDNPLSALIELRVAAAHEAAGRWLEAGEAFERAADVKSFPLRQTARAEAARCYAEAGEDTRALAAYDRVKREDPDAFLPEHVESRMAELRIAERLN